MTNQEPSIFKVWTVHRNNDDRFNGPITDVCSSEIKALAIAGRGWYGGNAPVFERWAVRLGENVYLLENIRPLDLDGERSQKKEELKKAALSKSSEEELEVLGLKNS